LIAYERAVRFQEVDAAGIVFFGRFLDYAHEAMEHFFAGLDGGYTRLIIERKVGLPAVHVEMNFASPVRYGDVVVIETRTKKLGKKSAVLGYVFKQRTSGAVVAEVEHTIVTTALAEMRSTDMPADVRAILAAHLAAP
jgi:4-hydroxybenzoyl-CoA thioesterase